MPNGVWEELAARWSETKDESSWGQVSSCAPNLEAAINVRFPAVAPMWMRSAYFRSINKPSIATDQVGSLKSSITLCQLSIKRRAALTAGRPYLAELFALLLKYSPDNNKDNVWPHANYKPSTGRLYIFRGWNTSSNGTENYSYPRIEQHSSLHFTAMQKLVFKFSWQQQRRIHGWRGVARRPWYTCRKHSSCRGEQVGAGGALINHSPTDS